MQNIDLVYALQPLIIIILSVGLIVYWRFKRSFKWSVLLYTLIAYAAVIALKDIIQLLTASAVVANFGAQSIAVGAYYGLQTVVFEIGGAYAVAWYVTSRNKFAAKDAEAYGLGLSFWENGILLGLLSLINLISFYAILSSNTSVASTLFAQLSSTQPSLFYPSSQALPLVGFGVLERISSLLIHFSWGYLCVVATCFHKKQYFLLALPMGLIDFFTPFAQMLTLPVFESLIFGLSLVALIVTILSTRKLRRSPQFQSTVQLTQPR
jgi:hypothetical protein